MISDVQETQIAAAEYVLYCDSTEFGMDESENYHEFLKINPNIKPATSTQMTKTEKCQVVHNSTNKPKRHSSAYTPTVTPLKKIKYIPSTSNSGIQNEIQTTPTNLDMTHQPIRQLQKCIEPNYVTNTSKTLASNSRELKIQNSPPEQDKFHYIETLLENLIKEVKYLRHEVKELRTLNVNHFQQNSLTPLSSRKLKLNIPCRKKEDFEELEKILLSDISAANTLEGILDNQCDRSINKYISHCLSAIMTNEVALSYSWYGKEATCKTAIQEYAAMNIIKECSLKKFPTTKPSEFVSIATKWFHYARGRLGKH